MIFYPSQIPDPGAKKALDPGSGFATLVSNTGNRSITVTKILPLSRIEIKEKLRWQQKHHKTCNNSELLKKDTYGYHLPKCARFEECHVRENLPVQIDAGPC
jgi:hypothetical protein